MKVKRFLLGCAVLAMTVGGGAMANEIYKWTDDEGNVHYEDRPTGAATEERMALSYRRTNASSVDQRVQSRIESMTARDEARAAAAEEAKAAEKKEAEAADKQKKCESYRARLQTFVQSRRLYREDADGERVYLDGTETQEARQKVEELIAEHCTS
ncbi:MAG: DUF4124 domain-containing protein [Gammaproteobacteria bacterium]|nr:DUF4124 domain-containing protein [Gammaproteobacteria bacterium]